MANILPTGRALKLRRWPVSVKVIAVLTCALLPLGIFATMTTALALGTVIAHAGHASVMEWIALGLPLTMWLAALFIGWVFADRLLIRPLRRMRAAVDRYGRGDTSIRLGVTGWSSAEMTALAAVFDRMASDSGRHDAEMTAALHEQKRLTREVHHRVKNNLQIVASLLSIQARETSNDEVARAYSTIQARVGALALVHRWMYDDESARGVDLHGLATDLCANLEQSITASGGAAPHIKCEVGRFAVHQDTAVPLAFLITELVSLAAQASAPNPAEVKITAAVDGGIARLAVGAAIFCDDALTTPSGPTVRIINGMARQMRAPLTHDPHGCTYTIEFGVPA